MPAWVTAGYAEYAQRLPRECSLVLHEVEPAKRAKSTDLERAKRDEGERLLALVPPAARVVALDIQGRPWSTEELAAKLAAWLAGGSDVALLVGGADGLSEACRNRAHETWSLSRLTLPHPLVRVVLAEQIYRAWSILKHHPYHRGG